MSDRELLELAAKVAGYQFSTSIRSFSHPPVPVILAESGRWKQWDPLHDDGDALRLAVKLDILKDIAHIPKMFANDPAEVRRAIVKVAVEIGKQNPA